MEPVTLFNAVMGILLMIGGWALRVIWDSLRRVQEDQAEFERHVSETYLRKDDYRDDMVEIKALIRQILAKLDDKEDRK